MTQADPATAGKEQVETDVGSVFVSNYPPFSFWGRDALGDVERALASPPRPDTDFGLYLHIPFCRKRCKFCYFRVYTDKNFDEIGTYLDALGREVELYADRPAIAGRPPKFVYFGGGTPSYISVKHLTALVDRVRAAIPWDGVEEVTFECEPGTLTRAKLEAIKGIGQGLVFPATCAPVGKDKQLSGIDPDTRRNRLTFLQLRHDLTDTVDQNVLVVDRRQPLHARRDLKPLVAILIALDRRLRLF